MSGACTFPRCPTFIQEGPAGGLADHIRTVHAGEPPPGSGAIVRRDGWRPDSAVVRRREIQAGKRRRAAAQRSRDQRRTDSE